MKVQMLPSCPMGTIKAIASKSVAHRLLICAAFADTKTIIKCEEINKDIEATAACLSALGVGISRNAPYYEVTPISTSAIIRNASLPCGESGSTLRFLLPIVAALGADSEFVMEGRLPERPLSPLREELEAHGISFLTKGSRLRIKGKLCAGNYKIAGNISSQFISGLLFGLSLLQGNSTLTVTGKIQSAPYINITTDALSAFSKAPKKEGNVYFISGNQRLASPHSLDVEGDWSNAAFMLALGVMGNGSLCVTGLNPKSSQGDMAIIKLLRNFGGNIEETEDGYIAKSSSLHGIKIDASQIPDLVPILATVASVAEGKTEIFGASRLRLKESDRIESICSVLSGLGADITATEDGIIIYGKNFLEGGHVSSFNDHRIAMSAAVAACVCRYAVTIDRAEATAKSYPDFWQDLTSVGIKFKTDV